MFKIKFFVCVLLAGTLCALASCKKGGSRSGFPPDITISNCSANPDPFPVHDGKSVDWEVGAGDKHDYTIQFSNPAEPTHNPFKINHGVGNPAHPIKGYSGCTKDGHGEFDCKYSLTRDNEQTPCADPIIHIVPGQGGS